MSYPGSERTQPQEPVIAILEDFVKPRFMGRHQRYKLFVTEKDLVFLRVNKRWFFNKKAELSNDEIRELSPIQIKRLSMGSYIVQIEMISEIKVKESIAFDLMLDPKEASSFSFNGLEDDIVHEVPLVHRRDKSRNVDIVERLWEVTFFSPRVTTSFLVSYNPKPQLPPVLLEKIKDN